ncbi:MAG: extradiol ring-cleavage dioxygenase [Candidatus Binatia bacterium]
MAIVFAGAASHAPGITAWTRAAPKAQRDRILSAYRELGRRLDAAKPDVLVVITVEHWTNFFLDNIPPFCLGRAGSYKGPVEPWLGIPQVQVPGDFQISCAVLEASYESGFDLSFSDELLFDHGTMVPLHFLTPQWDLPVVPLIVNALTPPMPTANRCYALGNAMGRALDHEPKRVALLATGGLSHWPGEPKAGKINIPFDRQFLSAVNDGDRCKLETYRHSDISEGGSGAHEVRTWITLAGMVPTWKAKLLAYEPVVPWATGCGLVHFYEPEVHET